MEMEIQNTKIYRMWQKEFYGGAGGEQFIGTNTYIKEKEKAQIKQPNCIH